MKKPGNEVAEVSLTTFDTCRRIPSIVGGATKGVTIGIVPLPNEA